MKILLREIEYCTECSYMSTSSDTRVTHITCKHREAPPVGLISHILRLPADHVIADIAIPGWCPLPDKKE